MVHHRPVVVLPVLAESGGTAAAGVRGFDSRQPRNGGERVFCAWVLMYEPQGFTPDGLMFVRPELLEWQPVPYLEPDDCEHVETMCRACVPSWENDYEVELPSWV